MLSVDDVQELPDCRLQYSRRVTLTQAGHDGADHDDLLGPEQGEPDRALIGTPGSRRGQILDRQIRALTKAGCIRIFADKLSGKTADRPELAACLDYLRAGDILVVPSLDRLSRSLQDPITIVAGLRRRGVGFRSLHEALDTPNSAGGSLCSGLVAGSAVKQGQSIQRRINEISVFQLPCAV